MQNYERVMKALARSDRGDDRQLAEDLVRHFTGWSRVGEKEKGGPRNGSNLAGGNTSTITKHAH